jgi:hypothetical protein
MGLRHLAGKVLLSVCHLTGLFVRCSGFMKGHHEGATHRRSHHQTCPGHCHRPQLRRLGRVLFHVAILQHCHEMHHCELCACASAPVHAVSSRASPSHHRQVCEHRSTTPVSRACTLDAPNNFISPVVDSVIRVRAVLLGNKDGFGQLRAVHAQVILVQHPTRKKFLIPAQLQPRSCRYRLSFRFLLLFGVEVSSTADKNKTP